MEEEVDEICGFVVGLVREEGMSLKVRAGSRREKSLVGGGEVLKSLGGVDKTGVGKW